MAEKTVGEINIGTRKSRSRERARVRKSYTDPDPLGIQFRTPCHHKESSKFKCSTITMQHVLKNRNRFYANESKVDQDIFLCRLSHSYEPLDRNRPKRNVRDRSVSCVYNLFVKRNKMKRVCKKMFAAAFSVSEKRLNNINKATLSGNIPKENRGGDHKSSKSIEKKEALRNFLKNLPATESHHNRAKSKRIYLSCELNCKKLLEYYNKSVTPELKIKKTMFYKIFHGEFNIGFKTPATDACSVCILWANRIKNEKDLTKKQEFITQLRVHKLRAKAFYDHMKANVPSSISLCFDLQQVQPLPKTPIQDSFYARQISLYNFCVVPLDSRNPLLYAWDQTIASRGSIEIGSALYNYLSTMDIGPDINTIRLFCDGCGGQNKNNHILHMLIQWLYSKSPKQVKEIHLYFPVRGHSFLPADRVFGRLEKDIKKKPIITNKGTYHNVFKKHGTVKILQKDWELLDIKTLTEHFKNLDGLQKMKKIKFRKIEKRNKAVGCTIQAFENYRFESGEVAQTLLKKGKRIPKEIDANEWNPQPIPINKKNDVIKLLTKQFGDEWADLPELTWYKKVLVEGVISTEAEEHECDYDCDCNEYDIGEIRI